jgi:hypothetical protein
VRNGRFGIVALGAIVIIGICWLIGSAFNHKPSVMNKDNISYNSGSGTTTSATTSVTKPSTTTTAKDDLSGSAVVPWDYKVVEAKVGDLVGEQMVLLPDNTMLDNMDNYATGDSIAVISFMTAQMTTDSTGKNDISLSAWQPIKTFKTKEEAEKDLAELKKQIKTEVDLVGVYKTENQGKFRYFAVLTMPTGQKIKQPIQEDRYNSFKSKKQVQVVLEEVHDFSDYDQTMAKFRGWAD